MLLAFGYLTAKKFKLVEDEENKGLLFPPKTSMIVMAFALLAFGVRYLETIHCK